MSLARRRRRLAEKRMAQMTAAQRELVQQTDAAINTLLGGQELDRIWFAAHPDRQWRLREALPGEAMAVLRQHWAANLQAGEALPELLFHPELCTHILTVQLAPGARSRTPCRPPHEGEERDAWVAAEGPRQLAKANGSLAWAEAMTPQARVDQIVWACLPPEAKAVRDRMELHFVEVGEAVRQSQAETKQ